MPLWTCETCGAQFLGQRKPASIPCPICEDERQYVNWKGQTWLTPGTGRALTGSSGATISASRHRRSSLVCDRPARAAGAAGGRLRDVGLHAAGDAEAVAHVRSLGGLKAIAISHPHYYGAVADWSEAFGGVPVYLHADDRAMGHAAASVDRALVRRQPSHLR